VVSISLSAIQTWLSDSVITQDVHNDIVTDPGGLKI
jgi:hypothetical protein